MKPTSGRTIDAGLVFLCLISLLAAPLSARAECEPVAPRIPAPLPAPEELLSLAEAFCESVSGCGIDIDLCTAEYLAAAQDPPGTPLAPPPSGEPVSSELIEVAVSSRPLDTDLDGVSDIEDNCVEIANGDFVPDSGGSSQLDRDADGIGNFCDCDFDNSGFCNLVDFWLFLPDIISGVDLGQGSDMDGSGTVDFTDFLRGLVPGLIRGEPGPSAPR